MGMVHFNKHVLLVGLLSTLGAFGCAYDVSPDVLGDFVVDAPTASPSPVGSPVMKPSEPMVPVLPSAPATEKLPPVRVWISPDVDHGDAIREGVAAWRETFEGVRDIVFVEAEAEAMVVNPAPADVAIYEIGPYGGTCAGENSGGGEGQVDEVTALGCVHDIGKLWQNTSGLALPVYIITPNADENPMLVTMHEMGHLFGLRDGEGVIMQKATQKALKATWECPDAEAVAKLEARLGVEGLTSCPVPSGVN